MPNKEHHKHLQKHSLLPQSSSAFYIFTFFLYTCISVFFGMLTLTAFVFAGNRPFSTVSIQSDL